MFRHWRVCGLLAITVLFSTALVNSNLVAASHQGDGATRTIRAETETPIALFTETPAPVGTATEIPTEIDLATETPMPTETPIPLPQLGLTCGKLPKPAQSPHVTCRLRGVGFSSYETISVTYRIEVDWLERATPRRTIAVYYHTSATDGHGAFVRPPLQFSIPRGAAIHQVRYKIQTSVTGARGDSIVLRVSS